MKRKFRLSVLIIILCLALCACGGGETLNEVPEPTNPTPVITEFVVHAYVPKAWGQPNLWAWSSVENVNVFDSWPGVAMESSGDGWYTVSLPSWIDYLIVNGCNGSVQTEDISVNSKELWIVVNADLSYELSYDGPIEIAQFVTVTAQVPAGWTDVRCWAWSDDGNVFEAWPGEAMVSDGDWYTIELPDWTGNLIINGKNGSIQTADLSIEPGKSAWVVVSDDNVGTVLYKKPTAAEIKELSHQWVEATCKNTRYCAICKETEGPFGDHTWAADGCLTVCTICDIVDGNAAPHTLAANSDGITGTCTACNKKVEYFTVDGNVYAWTEFETGTNNPVTYIWSRSHKQYNPIHWFKDGQIDGYEAEAFEKDIACKAFYANGKVYYFHAYSATNPEAVVRALANAASAYVSWTNCVYNESNCVYGNLVGPGGWIEDDRGHVYAALDVYGNQFCIVHKSSGSWEIPDDPAQTWAVSCNWMM